MTTYSFQVDAGEFCRAVRTSTLPSVQEYSFCIQIHEENLVTDLFMTYPNPGGEDYDVHASSRVPVIKYMNASGLKCEEHRVLEIGDREKFNYSYNQIKNLPPGSVIDLQAFNNNDDQLFDKIRIIRKTDDSESSLPLIEVDEVDGVIAEPEDYDSENEEAQVLYDSKNPENILFFSKRVEGYWIAVAVNKAGSIQELNTLRGHIEMEYAPVIEGESYIMGKARRGRKQAGTPAEPAEQGTDAPTCMACGDTGLNSKGGPCVCQKNVTPPAPPEPPPVVTPPPPPPIVETPPEEPPAPNATTEPPLDPETGKQENATPPPEPNKKKGGRRSKEQIRLDALEEAFEILETEQGAEDVTDRLEEFCKSILQSRGYTVERSMVEAEALTLEEKLGQVADSIGIVLGKLTQVKDQVKDAQAGTEGLCTKEEFLAKMMQNL